METITWTPRNDIDLVLPQRNVLTLRKDGYYFLNLRVTLISFNPLTVHLLCNKNKVLLKGQINPNTNSTGLLGKVEELSAQTNLSVSIHPQATNINYDALLTHLDMIYMYNSQSWSRGVPGHLFRDPRSSAPMVFVLYQTELSLLAAQGMMSLLQLCFSAFVINGRAKAFFTCLIERQLILVVLLLLSCYEGSQYLWSFSHQTVFTALLMSDISKCAVMNPRFNLDNRIKLSEVDVSCVVHIFMFYLLLGLKILCL